MLNFCKSLLVKEIYLVTQRFPKEEIFGLTAQLRRAAVSIPSNIAEGRGRATKGEFKQFLGNARGSLGEVETQVSIARSLDYLSEADANLMLPLLEDLGRSLNALISSVRQN
ncbi:MAG: four helix bundle protein [Deltaproteobacteria bacterium]|nr:four helix bundle protein [Deltaproteobacteria bacterium]